MKIPIPQHFQKTDGHILGSTRASRVLTGAPAGQGFSRWSARAPTTARGGAYAPPTASGGCRIFYTALRNGRGGFTLVEIMVVVIVIGILAATVIPKFAHTTHDAKVATAKANIAELDSALERYNVQMDTYPSTEDGLKALVEKPASDSGKWRGPYVKLLRPDPWGQQFQYRYPGTHHSSSPDLWAKDPEGGEIGNWQ